MPSFTQIRLPAAGPYATMCHINNAAGYAEGTTAAMTTDDILPAGDVRTVLQLASEVWAKNTNKPSQPIELVGKVTATSATSVRCQVTGTAFALVDNQELYTQDPAALAYTLALAQGWLLANAATAGVEVSEIEGRGLIAFTFWDHS